MSKKLFFKEYEGSIRLGAAHSLITGHGPRLAFIEQQAQQRKEEISKFGLFEYATPNFNTYYPNVTAEDLQPKEEEFIRPVYRALSEVIVRKNVDPLDFSKDGVLKASMGLLEAQTVYTNHDMFVGNEIGVVSKVFWDEGYTSNGIKVPAGINAEFLIDGKSHTNLVRKILMDPPAIHSNSVTVNFKWAPSHPKMDMQEFRSKAGTFDNKGELIRRIATEISAYFETSLVSHGADPFAQQVRDGKIVNPSFANVRDSFSEKKQGSSLYFMFSYKDSLQEITIPASLNNNETGEDETNKSQKPMKKESIILLAALIGFIIPAEQLSMSSEDFDEAFDLAALEAALATKQPELLASQTQLTALETEKQTLTTEKETAEAEVQRLTAEIAGLKVSEDEAAQIKSEMLSEVQRVYEAAVGKPATDALTQTFASSNFIALKSFKELYGAQLEEKFPGKCNSCGSGDIARNSSNPKNQEGDQGTSASLRDVRNNIRDGAIKLDPNRNY